MNRTSLGELPESLGNLREIILVL